MKKLLIIFGVMFLIVIVAVIGLLVWAGSAGQAKQEQFFRAVMSGDPTQVTAMFHPALRENVDEPMLAVWMRAARENLGEFKGLSKADFSTSVRYVDGAKHTESSGKVRFEKGEARSELVFRDDQLTKFNIESEKIPGDWFKSGPATIDLYHQRGQTFLEALFEKRAKDAFAMMHADFQAQLPLDKLEPMAVKVADAFGKIKSLKHDRDELDGPAGTLRIHYRLECEKAKASANALFTFVGLKGHITGFNVNEPESAGAGTGGADGQAALKALEDARKSGVLSEQEYLAKKAELEAALKPAPAEPAVTGEVRQKLAALDEARKSGVLSEQEYQAKKTQLEAALKPAPPEPAVTEEARRKLASLDGARKSGVLSEEEYQAKKAQLEAALKPAPAEPAVTEEVRQKLAALDEARKSGVLSEQEYQAKKAQLEAALKPAPAELAVTEEVRQKLAALEGARKSGVLSEQEFQKKKMELLGQPAPVGDGTTAKLPTAGKKGNIYRHALGFTFWYPDGWTVKEAEGGLQLYPANPGTKDGSPTELYFMVGDSLKEENASSASDPRIVAFLDQVIANLSPSLKRTAEPASIDVGKDKGVVLDWSGRSTTGNQVSARAFVAIINDYAIALIALGVSDLVKKRDGDLRSMFTSLGFGSGKLDNQLVGSWHLLSTYAISNDSPFETSSSRARMASDTNSIMTMAPDGTWTRTDTTQTIAMGAGVSIEGSDRKVHRGKWNADGGSLYLIGEDSSLEEYKYQVSGTPGARQVKLVSGGNGQVWQESR
jgi:hypothetical protein